jgi:hypothetical protein
MKIPKWANLPIQCAAKMGFFSRTVWDKALVREETSWHFKQWQFLTRSGLFSRSNRFVQSRRHAILTQKGRAVAKGLGYQPVNPPTGDSFEHDELVMEFAIKLQHNSLIETWITEQELKRDMYKHTPDSEERKRRKFPDLIIRLKVPGEPAYLAVEFERTRKASQRYNEFVNRYKRRPNIDSVVVLAQNQGIINAIKMAQLRNSYPQNIRPMVFGLIAEVIQSPARGKLDFNEKVITLEQTIHKLTEQRNLLAGQKAS